MTRPLDPARVRADAQVTFSVPREWMADLRCRFPTCSGNPVGLFHVPSGCVCWPDPIQALCAQHAVTAESTGPIICVFDFAEPQP